MSERANSSCLQDELATCQANQQWLCDKIFKKKKVIMQEELQSEESRVRICERQNFAYAKVSAEEGGGNARGAEAEISLQPTVKILERQLCLCSSWRGCRDPPGTHGGDPLLSKWIVVTPWKAPTRAGSSWGPMDPWKEEPMLGQIPW